MTFPINTVGHRKQQAESGGLPYPPPLDDYPAALAYSVRLLNINYSGDCMRVRRDSDNTTIEIGFDANGLFDILSCESFLGGSNGFVERIYEQSGNGTGYLEQTTSGQQAQIASSGSVFVDTNGVPYMTFDGVNDNYKNNTDTGTGGAYQRSVFTDVGHGYVFLVYEILDNSTTRGCPYELPTIGGTSRFLLAYNRATANRNEIIGRRLDADSAQIAETTSNYPGGIHLNTTRVDWATANAYMYYNGVNVLTDNSWSTPGNTSNTQSAVFSFGEQVNGNFEANMNWQEMIFYNTNESANQAAIESNITSYFSI